MSKQESANYHLDKEIREYKRINLKVEQDWLKSIHAAVNRVPSNVRTAIAVQFLLSLSKETARSYSEVIAQAFCESLPASEQGNLKPRHFKTALDVPVTSDALLAKMYDQAVMKEAVDRFIDEALDKANDTL